MDENEIFDKLKIGIASDEQIRECILSMEQLWEEKNIELDINLDEIEIKTDKELLSLNMEYFKNQNIPSSYNTFFELAQNVIIYTLYEVKYVYKY